MASISTDELSKALATLDEALSLYESANSGTPEAKAFRDACLQRFEYVLELSWKLSMKLLGSTTRAAKPAVREMARERLVDDPELWFQFIDARNETSHSYDEEIAERVFKSVRLLPDQVRELISRLDKL